MSSPVETTRQAVPFAEIFNFRDLGGHRSRFGGRVRHRVLYRADGVQRLAPDEDEQWRSLGVRLVVDLRTAAEVGRGAFPTDRHDAVTYHHLPVLREIWGEDAVREPGTPVEFLAGRYLVMLDEGADAIASTLNLLADPDQHAAVFHCAAGKDRTGVVAALVLRLLGVSADDVADDYARSAAGMTRLAEWWLATHPEAATTMDGRERDLLACPPEAMVEFLARLDDRFGSPADYVRHIGVDDDVVDGLRRHLLA